MTLNANDDFTNAENYRLVQKKQQATEFSGTYAQKCVYNFSSKIVSESHCFPNGWTNICECVWNSYVIHHSGDPYTQHLINSVVLSAVCLYVILHCSSCCGIEQCLSLRYIN